MLTSAVRIEKSSLDITRNSQQPLFGARSPLLIAANLRLESPHSIFGRTKLHGKLVGDIKGVSAILLRDSCRLLQHAHDILTSLVDGVMIGGDACFSCRCKRYDGL